jgi:hypothetical protein
MYQEDGFVVLESDQPEQFLTAQELQKKLLNILVSEEVDLPRELEKFDSLEKRAEYLMNNYFELDIGVNQYLQWYVVRLEK